MGGLYPLDPRVTQAIVAGLFLAVGWIVSGWQARRAEALRRAERLRDVHRGLFAEIGAWLSNIGSEALLEAERDEMVARMRADEGLVPFIPREAAGQLYRSILSEIHVLPRSSIDMVVAFYTQLAVIAALEEDMRSARYAELEQERRIAVYDDMISAKVMAFAVGRHALRLIDIYAKVGAAAAKAEQDRLRMQSINSRRVSDRSVR